MPIPSLKERPVLNSLYIPSMLPEPRSMDLDSLMFWVKRTPECIGIVKRIATDIVTNIYFKAIDEKTVGRPTKSPKSNKEIKAENFSRTVKYRKKMIALVMDRLITGDYYAWKGKISDEQVSKVAKEVYSEYGLEFKEIETKAYFNEEFNGYSAIEMVPSTMVSIEHDTHKITKFVQKNKTSPQDDKRFSPDEIIHQTTMDIDGSVYGFSPMEASYRTIRTINSIQDYAWYYFKNGAKLDRVWKFMGNVDEGYLKKFEKTLQDYKNVNRSHGDLILANADKIETENLTESEKDMQYRQLAIYSTGRLAFAFNMPADILSSILGADIKQAAGSSDIEDAGYNRNIEQAQRDEEDLWNSEFWVPYFKVEMKFERSFLQDKIQETQYRVQNVALANFFFQHEFPLTDEFYYDIFDLPREFIKEGKIKREIEIETPGGTPAGPPAGSGRQAYANEKRKQQSVQQANRSQKKEFFPTEVTPVEFLHEAKKWGVGLNSPIRIRSMETEDLVTLRLAVPHSMEELRTTLSKEEYDEGEWMNIAPISVPSFFGKEFHPTFVSPTVFLIETKRFGVGPGSPLRIRIMIQDELVYLKFSVPHTMEEIQTVITKKSYEAGNWMNIAPVSVPAIWAIPSEFKNFKKKILGG